MVTKKRKPARRRAVDLAKRPGKKPLKPGEETDRITVNLPRSLTIAMETAALRRQQSLSQYLRELVEHDLAS